MAVNVSVVIITQNAASTLRHTLDAIQGYDDVVVYDNGSTDDTCAIVRSFSNTTLHQGPFLGFGPTKQHAVSLARYDWILSLDADEAPSTDLNTNIQHWAANAMPQQVGKILRENWMMGCPIHHSGWGNDWLIRLFNRTQCNFNNAAVHESVQLSPHMTVNALTGKIKHLAITDLSQFLEKINRYSSIRAESGKLKLYSVPGIFFKAVFAFLRTYFLQQGWRDGWRGLVIAVSNANGVFWKYMKNYCVSRL
jgi:glycosyltransferase involved in cell wall biosynthesis